MSIFGYLFYLLAISFGFFSVWYSVKGWFYRRYWQICAVLMSVGMFLFPIGYLINRIYGAMDKDGLLYEPGFFLYPLGSMLIIVGIINVFVVSILSLYRAYNKK